jgi:hypothetical protein
VVTIPHLPVPVNEREGALPFAPSSPTVTFAPSRRHAAPIMLTVAALTLAAVGCSMNAWYSRSLGSTDAAGYLFLAVGIAADIAALALPACAARHWQGSRRATGAVAWAVWTMTFAFAVMSGIGFASVNVTEVTMSRAARVTPAVTVAQGALGDAMAARDRECKGGVGRWCRERERAVIDLRKVLDSAMALVAETADPQSQAAVRIVAWATRGALAPSADDVVMLRLMLLALLPQIGGILLMVGRR